MRRTKRSHLTLALFGSLALFAAGCSKEQAANTPAPQKSVSIKLVHGPELAEYMESIKTEYNRIGEKLSDGSVIKLELLSERGFSAPAKIATGTVKADAWLAQSSSDVEYVNTHIRHLGAKQSGCTVLFRTPMVIGIYEGDLEYLKSQREGNAFEEVLAMDFGGKVSLFPVKRQLTMSYPNPFQSTTGLSGLIQLHYLALTPDRDRLTTDRISIESVRQKIRRYEQLVTVQPGDELTMIKRGAHAQSKKLRLTIATEQAIARYNYTRNQEAEARALPIYPREGSYWNEYQLCTSDADWVTPQKRQAIKQILRFMSGETYQIRAKKAGFRPAVVPGPETEPLTPKFGVDLQVPSISLPSVPGKTMDYLLANWSASQPPIALVMVLDISGSMQGETLNSAKKVFKDFVLRKRKDDVVALLTNSTAPKLELDFTNDPKIFGDAVAKQDSIGGSALYDSIRLGVDMLSHESRIPYRKYLIFLTDGEDKNSQSSFKDTVAYVRTQLTKHDISIYITGITNANEDFADLKTIAQAAFGQFAEEGVQTIPAVFDSFAENLWGPPLRTE